MSFYWTKVLLYDLTKDLNPERNQSNKYGTCPLSTHVQHCQFCHPYALYFKLNHNCVKGHSSTCVKFKQNFIMSSWKPTWKNLLPHKISIFISDIQFLLKLVMYKDLSFGIKRTDTNTNWTWLENVWIKDSYCIDSHL